MNGGYLSTTSTVIASSSEYGLQAASGTAMITSSTFMGNTNYGAFVDGVANLTITLSTFLNNTTAAGFIALQNGPTFTHSGNSASGNGPSGGVSGEGNGFVMQGNLAVTSSTWSQDTIPYILSGGVTIPAGKTLTTNQGVVVKSDSVTIPAALTIDGKLIIAGTSTNPVYFTSIDDDSVDGDTDNSGSSTGTVGLWGSVVLDTGSTSTIQNAVFRYGGHASGGGSGANVYANGGYLSATSTIFASSSLYGLRMASGTVRITSSTFDGNVDYGFYIGNIGDFTVTTSSFSDNGIIAGDGAGFIAFDHGATFTSSGNISTRNTWNGFVVDGEMVANQTWTNDLPYIISGLVTVSSSKTLTVNPGAIIKLDNNQSSLIVDGTLNVKGTTSTKMIYFTSLKDDSIGGDTNNDGTSSSAAGGDWDNIQLDSGSSSTLNYAVVRYGGHVNTPSEADIYMGGGKLTAWHDIVASSTFEAIQVASGTLIIASSTIRGDDSTSTLDVANSTNVTSSFTAKQNYWDSSAGPYNASSHPTGTTDEVDDHVTFIPWLTSAPQ
jgi:hypothetical protein